MKFDTASLTNRGGRANNEDAYGSTGSAGLTAWAVADGLGGEEGGETASRLAVDSFLEAFERHPSLSRESLRDYVTQANRAIKEAQAAHPKLAQMGSTLVAAITDGSRLRSVHIGDSRFYWFRKNRVFFQSKDHSVPQTLCDAGLLSPDETRTHPNRNILVRCLGSPETPEPTVSPEGAITPGDTLLLCTDGFWGPISESEMEQELRDSTSASVWLHRLELLRQQRAPTLRDNDNYTATAIRVDDVGV